MGWNPHLIRCILYGRFKKTILVIRISRFQSIEDRPESYPTHRQAVSFTLIFLFYSKQQTVTKLSSSPALEGYIRTVPVQERHVYAEIDERMVSFSSPDYRNWWWHHERRGCYLGVEVNHRITLSAVLPRTYLPILWHPLVLSGITPHNTIS